MLIVFDLDDTLIDTSGSITPFLLKKVHETYGGDFKKLLTLNETLPSSGLALKEMYQGDVLEGARSLMRGPLPVDHRISLTPNAKEILELLKTKHTLALVTSGYAPFQREKLEKAGMDRGYFSKIWVSETAIKKPFYEALLKEFSREDILVCGDRVEMDLVPARELGLKTVHMRWGRGKLGPMWDETISDLSELKRILEK